MRFLNSKEKRIGTRRLTGGLLSLCLVAVMVLVVGTGLTSQRALEQPLQSEDPQVEAVDISEGSDASGDTAQPGDKGSLEVDSDPLYGEFEKATALILVDDSTDRDALAAVVASSDFIETKDISDQSGAAGYVKVSVDGNLSMSEVLAAFEDAGIEAQPNYVYTTLEDESEADTDQKELLASIDELDVFEALISENSADAEAVAENLQVAAEQAASGELAAAAIEAAEAVTTNDPRASEQWGLESIDIYRAWGISKSANEAGAPSVTVAVLDSGMNSHNDLNANVIACYNAAEALPDPGPGEIEHPDGDTQAGQPGVSTQALEDDLSTVTDVNGHGTHVAGIVSARADNGIGVAGSSYNAGLVIIKGTTSDTAGTSNKFTTASIAEGYRWLIEEKQNSLSSANVRVMNLSLGGQGTIEPDRAMEQKITEAKDAGILTVCAAGNGSGNTAYSVVPGDHPDCFTVINLQKTDSASPNDSSGNYEVSRYSNSNFNMEETHLKNISAPGESILSTVNSGPNDYGYKSGTSMATPLVSGAAAIVFAYNPSLTPDQVRSVLEQTATDLGEEGWDLQTGYGEVDAYHALQALSAQVATVDPVKVGESADLTISCADGSTLPASEWSWTSSDPAVSVDSDTGRVTAQTAGSSAVITGTYKAPSTAGSSASVLTLTQTITTQDESEPDPVTTYTVTYTDNAGGAVFTDQTTTVNAGDPTPVFVGAPDGTPSREGYSFDGWDPEVADTVTGDVTYTAQWTKNEEPVVTFTVIYTDGADGAVFPTQTHTVNANEPTPSFGENPTREGYDFSGWDPEWASTVTGDVTYTAQWTKTEEPVVTYTVTYRDNAGGAAFQDQVYTVNANERTPEFVGTPSRANYEFDGWDPEVALTVTGDVTYGAKWRVVTGPVNPSATDLSSATITNTTKEFAGYTDIASEIVVTLDGVKLTPYTDYMVSFDGGLAWKVGQVPFTVTGTGNYKGTIEGTFVITPADISTANIVPVERAVNYNSSGNYTLRLNDTTRQYDLNGPNTDNPDYRIVGFDNCDKPCLEKGANGPVAHIEGTGNYTGTRDVTFSIRAIQNNKYKFEVELPTDTYVYTGENITPIPVVKYDGKTLEYGVDFTCPKSSSHKDVGSKILEIKGAGAFSPKYAVLVGSNEVTLVGPNGVREANFTTNVNFTIAPKNLADEDVSVMPLQDLFFYNGDPQEMDFDITYKTETLTPGSAYTVSYANNTNVGTATATIEARSGNYTGSRTVNFEIRSTPKEITFENLDDLHYNLGNEVKHSNLVIKDGDKVLTEGVDYALSYENNRQVGTAQVRVNGLGNYQGRQWVKSFHVLAVSGPSGNQGNQGTTDPGNQGGNTNQGGTTNPGQPGSNAQAPVSAPSVSGSWVKSGGRWWFSYDGNTQATQGKRYPANEWVSVGGKLYHFDAAGWMHANWVYLDNAWYWFGSDGAMKTGWIKTGGKWYYLGGDGKMLTGKHAIGGAYYILEGGSGAMKTGWAWYDNAWHWCDSSGAVRTGWIKTGGKWYYLGGDGKMLTGKQVIGGKTYFLDTSNGDMKTGWVFYNSTWYWCDSSGAMVTGWIKTGGKWYYLDPSDGGAMVQYWKNIDGNTYFFDQSGKMLTGWVTIDGSTYFFTSSGDMVTNAWVANKWYVDVTGKWVDTK